MKLFNKFTYKFHSTLNVKIDLSQIFPFIMAFPVDPVSRLIRNKRKNCGIALLLLLATGLKAAPLTIIPNAPGALVTAGIPFAACALTDVSRFKLLNEAGAEVQIFIKPTLFWPASKCNGVATVRAVKVQFGYDAAQGQKVYNWQLATRSLPDLAEAPIEEIVSLNPKRAPYKEPVFFAINDPSYLVSTGLIPPTTVAGNNDYDSSWYPTAFNKRVSAIDFNTTVGENWLFDSVSSLYQQALRSGRVEQYHEAYLEHEFWISKMEVVAPADLGGFKLDSGDMKYMYLSPMKLHLALTGDDTWTPQENGVPHINAKDRYTLIKTIVGRATTVRGAGTAYNDITGFFTERNSGFALQQMVAAYELTNDPAILANLNTAVNNLYNMMTNNPDGLGNHGYLSHSWGVHEGHGSVYIGMTPVFSGAAGSVQTMSELIIRNPIGDDYLKMAAGSDVFFKPFGPEAKLAEPLVKNADGTLTMKLAAPVAIRSNQWAFFIRNGKAGSATFNFSADRVFSPWMQAIVADGLWQLYHLTDDTALQAKVSEMLLGFGRAVTAYAIDGLGLNPEIKSQIESAFGVRVVSGGTTSSRGIVPYTRYVANTEMAGPYSTREYIDFMSYDGASADQHSPEALFQISLAMKFETDPNKKAAMQSVASALTAWFATANISKTIVSSHPMRYFNWTNKQNAWGTYEAIKTGADAPGNGQIHNLVIPSDEILVNSALLINPVINGTLIGGSISGAVTSTKGTIQDVNLLAGTIVDGGTMKGHIRGTGLIINALIDAMEVGTGIWLGSGVRITASTLGNIAGKNISGLVFTHDGKLNFSAGLLIDAQQNELSLLHLVTQSLNKHFGNNATSVKQDNENGLISFINSEFDDSYITLRPTSIVVANNPDAISTNHRGDLVISSSGLNISFAAVPHDLDAFENGLDAINAIAKYFGNGLIEADVAGTRFVFRLGQQSLQKDSSENAEAATIPTTNTATVSFTPDGSISNPQTYRINAIYADGSIQVLLPYVHDIEGFEAWMLGAGYTYSMDATEGFVHVYYKNTPIWRGIPGYTMNPDQKQTVVQIANGGDLNSDGYADFLLSSPAGTQVMFTLPMN